MKGDYSTQEEIMRLRSTLVLILVEENLLGYRSERLLASKWDLIMGSERSNHVSPGHSQPWGRASGNTISEQTLRILANYTKHYFYHFLPRLPPQNT